MMDEKKSIEFAPGQVVSSEFEVQPGLFDRLLLVQEANIADDDPTLPSLVSAEEFLSFSYQTRVLWSEDTEKILIGDLPYGQSVAQGLFRRMWDWFSGAKSLGKEETTGCVRILGIHRPRVDGCTAEFELSATSKSDYSFKINVLGSGGGSGGTKSFGRSCAHKADKDCVEYWVPVRARIRVYERKDGRRFTRTDVVDIQDDHHVIPIPRSQDECGGTRSPVRDLSGREKKFDIRASGIFRHEIEVATGTQAGWQIGIKPSLPVLGQSEIGLTGSVEALKTIAFKYELVGEHTYTAFEMPETIGFSWKWEASR